MLQVQGTALTVSSVYLSNPHFRVLAQKHLPLLLGDSSLAAHLGRPGVWLLKGAHMQDIGVGIAAMAAVGLNIWVGQVDGRIRVYKDGGSRAQHEWQGHDAGIIAIVPCGSRAFSLAADGSLKGWSSLTPSPLDANIRSVLLL